jgi:putative transposase
VLVWAGAASERPELASVLCAQAKRIVSCDFFTVETVFLKTLYVLVFMHIQAFAAEGVKVVITPYRTPQANAHAERLIGSLRREVLDHVLIVGRGHLSDVLREYAEHHNSHRPHRALDLRRPHDIGRPIQGSGRARPARTQRRATLGGLIHEYYARAA